MNIRLCVRMTLGVTWVLGACAAMGASDGKGADSSDLGDLVSASNRIRAVLVSQSPHRVSPYDVRPEDLPPMTPVLVSGENETLEWLGRLGERAFMQRGNHLEVLLGLVGSWSLERRIAFPTQPYGAILFMRDGRFLLYYERCYGKGPGCKSPIHALDLASEQATLLGEGDFRDVEEVFRSWRVGYPEPAITTPGHREVIKLLSTHPWLAQNYPGGLIHELAWRTPERCRDSRLPSLLAERGALYPATDFVLSRRFGRKRWVGPTAWGFLYSEDCVSALVIFSGYPMEGREPQYHKVQRYVMEVLLP